MATASASPDAARAGYQGYRRAPPGRGKGGGSRNSSDTHGGGRSATVEMLLRRAPDGGDGEPERECREGVASSQAHLQQWTGAERRWSAEVVGGREKWNREWQLASALFVFLGRSNQTTPKGVTNIKYRVGARVLLSVAVSVPARSATSSVRMCLEGRGDSAVRNMKGRMMIQCVTERKEPGEDASRGGPFPLHPLHRVKRAQYTPRVG